MDFTICGLHPYVVAAFVGLLVGYNFALSRAFEKTRDQLEKLEAEELRSGVQYKYGPPDFVVKPAGFG